ncbi:hypothetical protein RUM43_004195 [Polyplax serrata]|uniref:Uncharacterized protein n=1 Tax=Polyplax serrata TaxID=468196 RepID=A0AAN8SAM4_POLSC
MSRLGDFYKVKRLAGIRLNNRNVGRLPLWIRNDRPPFSRPGDNWILENLGGSGNGQPTPGNREKLGEREREQRRRTQHPVFYAFFSCTENADATKEVFPAPVPGLGTGPPGTTLLQDIPCN